MQILEYFRSRMAILCMRTAQRPRIKTETLPNGTKVTRAVAGPVLEWRLQAAGVRALKALPGYLAEVPANGVIPHDAFTLAGDMNAAVRGPKAMTIAKATGLAAGEHDVRIYMAGARLGLIEVKAKKGRLTPDQRIRHPLLHALGFTLQAIVQVSTEEEAAREFVRVVRGWLAANDNGEGV